MLANIEEPIVAAVASAIAVIGVIACVQYSAYVEHMKKHIEDEESDAKKLTQKFAFIPYLFIPIIFGALAVLIGMSVGDIVIARGYISGAEETVLAVCAASVAVYAVMDYALVGKVGDLAYFKMVEAKLFQSVDEVIDEVKEEEDPEVAALKKKLAMLKELGLI